MEIIELWRASLRLIRSALCFPSFLGATIFYTVNSTTPTHHGSTPTGSTAVYGGPVNVAPGKDKFFEAIAYKAGMSDSAVSSFDADNTNPTL